MNSAPVLAIDFGTSNSMVSWYNPKLEAPEIIRNEHGDEKTPSIIYWGEDHFLIGKPALEQLSECIHMEPEERSDVLSRTFLNLKTMLKDNVPLALPDGLIVTPVDLVSDILFHLKDGAEKRCFNGESVKAVVLTHPVAFSRKEKDHLLQAASMAGFEKACLLEEPVAAIHGYRSAGYKTGNGILVFDMGGGTLDVAFMEWDDTNDYGMPVQPIGNHNGGSAYDRMIYDHFERELQTQSGVRFSDVSGMLNLSMLDECRQVKEKLSSRSQTRISYFVEAQNKRITFQLSRNDFENLIADTVESDMRELQVMVQEIEEAQCSIDSVVLIGGSTRVPLLSESLNKHLPVKPFETMHADSAVVLGAASVASLGDIRFENTPNVAAPKTLQEAVEFGDALAVRRLLQQATERAPFEAGALHKAAEKGCLKICQLLVRAGYDIKEIYKNTTALHAAVIYNQQHVVTFLAEYMRDDGDVNFSVIHYAAVVGDLGSFEQAVASGQDVDCMDFSNMTPLMWAAGNRHLDVTIYLVHNRCHVDMRDGDVFSPLSIVARTGDSNVFEYLLHVASNIDIIDSQLMTPLMHAIQHNHQHLVKMLIDAGANLSLVTDDGGYTESLVSAELAYDDLSLVDTVVLENIGTTALHFAAHHGYLEAARFLIYAGMNVDTISLFGETALIHAAEYGHLNLVQFLVEAGADIEARNKGQCTPLMRATLYGYADIVAYLLGAGADISAVEEYNYTALHIAAKEGKLEACRVLVDFGADIEVRNAEQITPLIDAARRGHASVVSYLLSVGADITEVDKYRPEGLYSDVYAILKKEGALLVDCSKVEIW